MSIHYIPLGATDRIGASCHYLQLDEWGILLDAGLDPHDSEADKLPDFDLIKDRPVHAIILSHAHLDHIGALPVAVRYFPQARVYMTPPTAALSEIMLFHYLQVQKKRSLQENKVFHPAYLPEEAENTLYLFQSFDYNFPFKIHSFQESEIEVIFWDAGHILGSAGIELNWKGRRLFYTGNTKKSSQFILRGASYPEKTEILVTECTYGGNEKAPRLKKRSEVRRFAEFINRHINFGGGILIPVFALGRTQEMMYLLHRLIMRRTIPAVPIYLTGFGIKINKVYDRLLHKIYPKYDARLLKTITFDNLRGKTYRKPCIILATSGMMWPHTISYEIAGEFLQDARNGIALVGWADPETPGASLRDKKLDQMKSVFRIESVQSGIETFLFSAHSHRRELLDMVKSLHPEKTVLCHGDPDALRWVYDQIEKNRICREVMIPEEGVIMEL